MTKAKQERNGLVGMSQKEYADYRNVSQARISQLRKAGRLVLLEGNRIDVVGSDAVLDTALPPGRNAPYYAALTEKTRLQAQHSALDLKARQGELIERAEVFEWEAKAFGMCQNRLRSLPHKLAATLLGQTNPNLVAALLKVEIDAALEDLESAFSRQPGFPYYAETHKDDPVPAVPEMARASSLSQFAVLQLQLLPRRLFELADKGPWIGWAGDPAVWWRSMLQTECEQLADAIRKRGHALDTTAST